MRAKKRIQNEAAYVLHQRDFSETSLILEVFTRHFGRLALLAKGVKRPLSSFRAVLLPLQTVQIGFSLNGAAEDTLAVLQGVEWGGLLPMPRGSSLLAGLYLNELILKLLAREDPHPALFDVFHQTVQTLGLNTEANQAPVLRAFELQLLYSLGFLPSLSRPASSTQALNEQSSYRLEAACGLVLCDPGQGGEEQYSTLSAAQWLALDQALHTQPVPANLEALQCLLCEFDKATQRSLRLQLGGAIAHCLQLHQSTPGSTANALTLNTSGTGLRTRQFMTELHTLQAFTSKL